MMRKFNKPKIILKLLFPIILVFKFLYLNIYRFFTHIENNMPYFTFKAMAKREIKYFIRILKNAGQKIYSHSSNYSECLEKATKFESEGDVDSAIDNYLSALDGLNPFLHKNLKPLILDTNYKLG